MQFPKINITFLKQNWIGIIAVAVILIVVYKFYQMFKEQPEPGEVNAAGTDYAPVSYASVKLANFNISEMTCKDGTKVPAQFTGNALRVLQNLQVLRDAIGLPIHINSGYRSPAYNAKVGGAPGSAHKRAMACDIVVVGMTPTAVRAKIQELIKAGKMQNGGLGSYKTFTHYDVSTPRRWNG